MLEKWETPRVTIQEFEPNEYVAACWQIACSVGADGRVDQANPDPISGYNNGITHSHNSDKTGCGWADSQYIVEVSDGVFNVTEYGQNILPCSLTKDDQWRDLKSTITDVKPGDMIYWTTSLDNRTWHHYGTVGAEDPNHPNRS